MKKILCLFCSCMMVLLLASCTAKGTKAYESNTNLISIAGADDLYYDRSTMVVYFVFNEYMGYQGYGYMSAYYAPNGLPYLYDPLNQELVEISSNTD